MKTCKCPNCHREIEMEDNIVMVQCKCGEVAYDRYAEELRS